MAGSMVFTVIASLVGPAITYAVASGWARAQRKQARLTRWRKAAGMLGGTVEPATPCPRLTVTLHGRTLGNHADRGEHVAIVSCPAPAAQDPVMAAHPLWHDAPSQRALEQAGNPSCTIGDGAVQLTVAHDAEPEQIAEVFHAACAVARAIDRLRERWGKVAEALGAQLVRGDGLPVLRLDDVTIAVAQREETMRIRAARTRPLAGEPRDFFAGGQLVEPPPGKPPIPAALAERLVALRPVRAALGEQEAVVQLEGLEPHAEPFAAAAAICRQLDDAARGPYR